MPVAAIVDDDAFMLTALGRTLSWAGYRTLLFNNPLTALNGIPPAGVDLVIVDRNMPKCSGPELARRLRDGWNGGGPPLVLLSGDLGGLAEYERKPFDLILGKPIRPDELMTAIGNVGRDRRPNDAVGF
jgi:DNA-binding response OmpR family regulator